jgi:Holliday junction DNA helicase RuvA
MVLVEVAGLTLGVSCSHPERYAVGKEAIIPAALIWNQEKGPSIYGFFDDLEKKLFGMLISCPKIGPSIALQILSQMSPVDCISAIARSDSKALSSLNGIGAKKAAQIITDLQEQCSALKLSGVASGGAMAVADTVRLDVAQALESLGYTKQESAKALQNVTEEDLAFDQLLRACLRALSSAK